MTTSHDRYHHTQQSVLAWYADAARDLPWRVRPQDRAGASGLTPIMWLSEIMLQQTTVATVKSYFTKFTSIWLRVTILAAADRDDVMSAWAGLDIMLGRVIFIRRRKLLLMNMAALSPIPKRVCAPFRALGRTRAAIASIAFGRRAVVLDGNIERVTARFDKIETPLPKARIVIGDG